MPDQRSELEKKIDATFGMPLYYCAECKRGVDVKVDGSEVKIERPCGVSCQAEVIAPRRAIAVGKGGASVGTRAKIAFYKLLATLTNRCI